MAINILDILEPAGEDFKVVHAKDVEYTDKITENGQQIEVSTNVQDKIEELEDLLKSEPELSTTTELKQYFSIGSIPQLIFRFTTSAVGQATITIYQNGNIYKTLKVTPGATVMENLPEVKSSGQYTYLISAVDALGRPAPNNLIFNYFYGGVELNSNYSEIINSQIISENEVFDFHIPYNLTYAEEGLERQIIIQIKKYKSNDMLESDIVYNDIKDLGIANIYNGYIDFPYEFNNSGKYALTLQGKIKDSDDLKSQIITYNFSVLPDNCINIDILDYSKNNLNTNSPIWVKYRIISNNNSLSSSRPQALKAICKVYKDEEVNPILERTEEYLTSTDISTFNLGRLQQEGTYKIEISGQAQNGTFTGTIQSATISLEIIDTSQEDIVTVTTQNLLAYFDAEHYTNGSDKWFSRLDQNYYIQLNGFNYVTNGLGEADDDHLPIMRFTPETYGIVYKQIKDSYVPYSPLEGMGGYTIEAMYKTVDIGEINAKVLSCIRRKKDGEKYHPGFYISHQSARIEGVGCKLERPTQENLWTHIALVFDNEIRDDTALIPNQNIPYSLEDRNYYNTVRIYINGCMVGCAQTDKWSFIEEGDESTILPLTLNGNYNLKGMLEELGNSEFKFIRLYNDRLTSTEVINNYIASIRNNDELKDKLLNKNLKTSTAKMLIPQIHFVRNLKPILNPSKGDSKVEQFEGVGEKVGLHDITEKTNDDPSVATSKNSWVNCTMWYEYYDANNIKQTRIYEDVDVFLQGTSSLVYPVKNYQIKVYGTPKDYTAEYKKHGDKLKFIPPSVGPDQGWFEETADYVYTLKCDFMDHSHKNNTCTAQYYEQVVDNLSNSSVTHHITADGENIILTDEDKKSVAKRAIIPKSPTNTSDITPQFRDAINGFPVLVYYNDNNLTGTDCNYTKDNQYGYADCDTYAGSYMFNVDKEGRQLGFEIETNNQEEITLEDNGKIYKILNPKNQILTRDILPCVSLEGSVNQGEFSAGAFYTYEEYKEKNPNSNVDIYSYCSSSFDPRYTYTDDITEIEGNYTLVEITDQEEKEEKIISYSELINKLNYNFLIKTINWLKETENDEIRFKKEFSQYFSYTYCLAYFLQMEMFTQVDNAGKNAMFDTWGGKWYPRPYDMDTQMGLDNEGNDNIHSSAEMSPLMTQQKIAGNSETQKDKAVIYDSNGNKIVDFNQDSHLRFTDYNTSDSRLWISFAKHFKSEIATAYRYLRGEGLYDIEAITSFVGQKTTDIIGEIYYNKDAVSKYIKPQSRIYCCQGNRDNRYKQFLQQRMTYLDTKYSLLTQSNSTCSLRSEAYAVRGDETIFLGISTYSPQYVTLDVGTNEVSFTIYVDENSTYIHPITKTPYRGVLIKIPLSAGDKEVRISGSGNIRAFNHMEAFCLGGADLSNAKKLSNFHIINAPKLNGVTIDSNFYMKEFVLNNCAEFKGQIDLSKCSNLQKLEVANAPINSLDLPNGAPINTLKLSNIGISFLQLSNLLALKQGRIINATEYEGLIIENCYNIDTLKFNNLSLITDLAITTDSFPQLTSIEIANCDGLRTLDLNHTTLNSLNIPNCNNLNKLILSSCQGAAFKNLILNSLTNLTELYLDEIKATDDYNVKILLPEWKTGDNKLPLTILQAKNSTLEEIDYGVDFNTTKEIPQVDLKALDLTNFSFENNKVVKEVINLNAHDIDLNSAFQACEALTKVTGTITNCLGTNELFRGDSLLTDLTELDFVFNDNYVQPVDDKNQPMFNASLMFYSCSSLSKDSVDNIIPQLGDKVTIANYTFGDCNSINNNLGEPPSLSAWTNLQKANYLFRGCKNITKIPKNYFNSNTNIKELSWAFSAMTNLTTVDSSAFSALSSLNYIKGMFADSDNLTNFWSTSATSISSVFHSNAISNFTDLSYLFYNCSKLTHKNSGDFLKALFTPKLIRADAIFYGNTKLTAIPNGILSNCEALKSIGGLFGKTGITTLPEYLCHDGSSSKTLTNLINATGLFEDCTKLTGIISKNFFAGLNNLKYLGLRHIGDYVKDGKGNIDASISTCYGDGYSILWTKGAFCNTKIEGFHKDFLKQLTELIDISTLFAKGDLAKSDGTTSNVAALTTIKAYFTPKTYNQSSDFTLARALNKFSYGEGENITSISNKIPIDLLPNTNTLTTLDFCFAGNTEMYGFYDTNARQDVKGTNFLTNSITSTSGIFANCYDPNTNHGIGFNISADCQPYLGLFQNKPNLVYINQSFANCQSIFGSIPNNLFKESSKLYNMSKLFYNCTSLGINDEKTSISIPVDLFASCRNSLYNVSFMFSGCGFRGQIGNRRTEKDYKGLLYDCTKLLSTQGMFAHCHDLVGPIPEDIFCTSSDTTEFESLTSISEMFNNCWGLGINIFEGTAEIVGNSANATVIYGPISNAVGQEPTLIPKDWLKKCPNITNISYLFNNIATANKQHLPVDTNSNNFVDFNAADPDLSQQRYISNDTLTELEKIQSAAYVFSNIYILTGKISNGFLSYSSQALKNIEGIFMEDRRLTTISENDNDIAFQPIQNPELANVTKNNYMTNMKNAFYNCSGLTGWGPMVYKNYYLSSLATDRMVYGTNLSNKDSYGGAAKAPFAAGTYTASTYFTNLGTKPLIFDAVKNTII